MKSLVALLCLAASVYAGHLPECDMNAMQLLTYWGYPYEEYTVTTDDHYILSLHRVPHGKGGQKGGPQKPVVFLQHGLEGASTDWLVNLPHQSAGMVFADAGFDVWFGNFRGNTYSNRKLDPEMTDDEYWDFSWDDSALQDLPAMIDYVLRMTGQKQLSYIAHSEGTMCMFALAAERPEYVKEKVSNYFALAPVATNAHMGGMMHYISKMPTALMFKVLGVHQFMPQSWLMTTVGELICGPKFTDKLVCENLYFLLVGPKTGGLNATRLEVYIAHDPAGTSGKTIIHFSQGAKSGRFAAFDYGTVGNLRKYGTTTPPAYDLSKITVPTYLYYGAEDVLADPKDVEGALIPNVKSIKGVNKVKMNHCDFIFGINATNQVYNPIINIIRQGAN